MTRRFCIFLLAGAAGAQVLRPGSATSWIVKDRSVL